MTNSSEGLLLIFEKPSGVLSSMTYDSMGRLLTDSSSAGSSTTLARVNNGSGFMITETSELGRVKNHTISSSGNGYIRTTNSPNMKTNIHNEDLLLKIFQTMIPEV